MIFRNISFQYKFHSSDIEAITWLGSLIFFALINPASGNHFTICIFKLTGMHWCPGCGLGHSISYLLHLDLWQSLKAHPLGIFALFVLVMRIYTLLSKSFKIRLFASFNN